MLPEFTPAEFAAALDAIVIELLAAADVAAPPVDAFRVAEHCRLAVGLDDRQASRARLVRLARRSPAHKEGAIFIRSDPRPERRQWAVAHEVGEAQAERVFRALGVRPSEAPPTAREEAANSLASHSAIAHRLVRVACPSRSLGLGAAQATVLHGEP